ncbi:MAG TPA: type II toxin-antitoxin system VapC family toxin [Casimicrobiaceae bacterium]|nr:type II toxin-antitoxin system VapC family toxin [Casimicrobiaceae bacterium]
MRLLLDTHVLLWVLGSPEKLPRSTRKIILDSANEVWFSVASIWEIAIKSQLRRVDFKVNPEQVARAAAESGLDELPIRAEHAALTARLPTHHRDPFDRLLVAQALIEPARLLTADKALRPYSDLVEVI